MRIKKNLLDKSFDRFLVEVGSLSLILLGGLMGILTLAIIDAPSVFFGLVAFVMIWFII